MPTDEGADALSALNRMMHGWAAQGLEYEHTTLTMNDDFPLPEKLEDSVVALLAERLAEEYAEDVAGPKLAVMARKARAALAGEYWTTPTTVSDIPVRLPSDDA